MAIFTKLKVSLKTKELCENELKRLEIETEFLKRTDPFSNSILILSVRHLIVSIVMNGGIVAYWPNVPIDHTKEIEPFDKKYWSEEIGWDWENYHYEVLMDEDGNKIYY